MRYEASRKLSDVKKRRASRGEKVAMPPRQQWSSHSLCFLFPKPRYLELLIVSNINGNLES